MPQAQPQDLQNPRNMDEVTQSLIQIEGTRNWSSDNIREKENTQLFAVLGALSADAPQYTNQFKPSNMTAEQFHRMIVRECQRRGILDDYYEGRINYAETGRIARDNPVADIARSFVRRSFSFPNEENGTPANLEMNPLQVAIYDAGTDMFFRNQLVSPLSSDVARALNLPRKPDGKPYEIGMTTDVDHYTLGYALGSMNEINPANPNAQTTVRATVDNTPENIQAAFCREVPKLFEAGRGMQPRDAAVAGFMQGRIDARSNFEGRETEVGLFAPCPTPANTNVPVARTASNQR